MERLADASHNVLHLHASTARPNPYCHPAQCCAQLGNKTVPIRYLDKTAFFATKENPRHPIGIAGIIWLRGLDLNQRPSGYESRA